MAWAPQYHITDRLLVTIRQIGEVIGEIRHAGLNQSSLATLEYRARQLSSFASTSIEGNPLRLTDVKRLLKQRPEHIRDTEREVLNYNRALNAIQHSVHEGTLAFNRNTLEHIQGTVMQGLMPTKRDIGHIRKDPVVIRHATRPDAIVYLPPDAKDVAKLLKELFSFIHKKRGAIEPIILAGLFHRQCVIIHPFMDGNGRITRLMTTALLGKLDFDVFSIFSFENYYNQNISRYFQEVGLQGDYYDLADTIDHTDWLAYFAEGILDELRRVHKTLPQPMDRLEKHHKQLLDYLAEHNSITQREYGHISNRSLAARKQDFKKLTEMGLIERKGGGRSAYYVLKI